MTNCNIVKVIISNYCIKVRSIFYAPATNIDTASIENERNWAIQLGLQIIQHYPMDQNKIFEKAEALKDGQDNPFINAGDWSRTLNILEKNAIELFGK
jgi:hypothetical protein